MTLKHDFKKWINNILEVFFNATILTIIYMSPASCDHFLSVFNNEQQSK